MKILYLSCHEILEYDEVKLFTEMGHEVYSNGAYVQNSDEGKRPAIPNLPYDPHFVELALQHSKENLIAEQLEGFDMVIVMHVPDWIINNWGIFKPFINKGGRVVWRTIGQSTVAVEAKLAPFRKGGLEVVRYSPAEQTIEGNIGADAMIRFYKDEQEFNNWNGAQKQIVNFTQSLTQRGEHVGSDLFMKLTEGLPTTVYGPNNEDLGEMSGGLLSYKDQKQALRDNRVYLYTGTQPASYTLSFMEAMMTGIPIVALGRGLHGDIYQGQRTYEIPDIIIHGKSGFVGDDMGELRNCLKLMLNHPQRAKEISLFGRQRAIELFGKHKIRRQWEIFLSK